MIELKRAVDTRLRREVVGQMLDYAANAATFWRAGNIAESFAKTNEGRDPEQLLHDFIGDRDASEFWNQVDANMNAGRIKLVFVADEIPRELARIVEFLNEQMRADVRAVELRWFAGDDGVIALSPRIIGETERAVSMKSPATVRSPLSLDEWLEKFITPHGEKAILGAKNYIRAIEQHGGKCGIPATQGSIYAKFTGADQKPFFPLHLWCSSQKPQISLSMKYLYYRNSTSSDEVRQNLFSSLSDAVGELSTPNLRGFPGFRPELLADAETCKRFSEWLESNLPRMR